MIIYSIDPGTTQSGVACFNTETKEFWGSKIINEQVVDFIDLQTPDEVVIEDIVNQGSNSRFLILTIRWSGRMDQTCTNHNIPFTYISRPDVKKHLTGKVNKINDSKIRAKVIEKVEPTYTLKKPGRLRGFKADAWQALALLLVHLERKGIDYAD